jgi:hypothetical protein
VKVDIELAVALKRFIGGRATVGLDCQRAGLPGKWRALRRCTHAEAAAFARSALAAESGDLLLW